MNLVDNDYFGVFGFVENSVKTLFNVKSFYVNHFFAEENNENQP